MVNKSAGEVVGASQAGKENIDALETIDFTKMSYTQTKKIEMDTQVKCNSFLYIKTSAASKILETIKFCQIPYA